MALSLLGDKVSAEKAVEWGMIWRCVEDDQLSDEAQKMAKHLAAQPTTGLVMTRQAINAAADNTLEQQMALEADLQRLAAQTDDYLEGVAAFSEKRAPNFKGH